MNSEFAAEEIKDFQYKILSYYAMYGREMPWRSTVTPYTVFVSEIMLQQTQVTRVEKYFIPFCRSFPNFKTLSEAPLDNLLLAWKGLGYNRRAVFMRKSAAIIQKEYNGQLPSDPRVLARLPGIGPNTAGSIAAFAFNRPVVFIETNVRRVFIHEFFQNTENVDDRMILPLIERMLPEKNIRTWYWALMDYGVGLKQKGREAARKSRHYSSQSTFEGSTRQLRAAILHELALRSQNFQNSDIINLASRLRTVLPKHPFTYELLGETLARLQREGFVVAEHNESAPEDISYSLNK